MSKLTNLGAGSKLAALVGQIQQYTVDSAGRYNSGDALAVASLESADAGTVTRLHNNYRDFTTQMNTMFSANDELKQYAPSQISIEAANIILAASQDPSKYVRAAKDAMGAGHGDLKVFEHGASLGLEAFDNREIAASTELSVAYQLLTARQNKIGEALYRTLVLTPDQAMYRVTVDRIFVTNGAKHKLNGDVIELKKTNVLEAYRNPEVLRTASTVIVPEVTAQNVAKFINPAIIAPSPELVDGYEVTTAPIAVGADDYSLLALGMHQGVIDSGLFNQNEALDHNLGLKELIVSVTDGTDTEYVKFNVKNMPTARVVKTPEQGGKLTRLAFRTDGIRVSGGTKTVAGAASTLLAPLDAISGTLSLRLSINADVALDRGTVSGFSAQPIKKMSIETVDGSVFPGASHASTTGLTFAVVGYTWDARRTNSALKTRGLLADSDIYQEVFTVGLLPPITVQRPRSEELGRDLETLVHLSHLQISIGAIDKLLEYNETVKTYFIDNVKNTSTADWITGGNIEGIARMLITPYHDAFEIKLDEVLNSVSSYNKLNDVRGHFVHSMTEAAYRMIQRTGYRPALEMLSPGANRKVQITAATDNILPQYIMLPGDDRVAGPMIDMTVESSDDVRMLGKIYMVFTTKSTEFDPLQFGNLLWIPELVSKQDVSREGQQIRELTVHPRWRHINNVPAMIEITVTGLKQVMQTRVSYDINNTVMNPEDLQPVTP